MKAVRVHSTEERVPQRDHSEQVEVSLEYSAAYLPICMRKLIKARRMLKTPE